MALNKTLKQAIADSGMKQSFIAKRAGMSEWRLSRIVNDHTPATANERDAIAAALGRAVESLFSGVAA